MKVVRNVKVVAEAASDATTVNVAKNSLAYVGMFLGTGAGTMPSFLDDNRKFWERKKEAGKKAVEHTDSVKPNNYTVNREEYERLLNDPNYTDVAFDEKSGGVKATHIGHNFDHLKGDYEKTVQDIGFRNGHSVILGDEPQNRFGERSCEGLWDKHSFEVAGAETGTANNIRNAIKHCARKPGTEVAVIYLPNIVEIGNIRQGLAKYNGLSVNQDSQWKRFEKIIFIGKDDIISQ